MLKSNSDLPYRTILSKMEGRFGAKLQAKAAQAKFAQATQTKRETIEDWVDRVQALAMEIFHNLNSIVTSKPFNGFATVFQM